MFYIVWNLTKYKFDVAQCTQYLLSLVRVKGIIKLIILSDTSLICIPLWFLPCLALCYCLMLLLHRIKNNKAFLWSAVILLLIRIAGFGLLYILGISIPDAFRRGLLLGLPFFLMGYYLRHSELEIGRLQNKILLAGTGISLVMIVAEDYIFSKVSQVNGITSIGLYFGNVLLALCVFIICLKLPERKLGKVLNHIGKNESMFIYILHPFVIDVVNIVLMKAGILLNMYGIALLVVVNSVLLAWLLHGITKFAFKRSKKL